MSSSITPEVKPLSLEENFIEAFPNDKALHTLIRDVDAAWMVYMYSGHAMQHVKRRQYEEIRDIFFNSLSMEQLIFIEKRCHFKSDFGIATSAKIVEKALLED